MHLDCPHCCQTLEYSGKRPTFCGYCGKSIGQSKPEVTGAFAEAATLPPERGNGEPGADPGAVGGYRLIRPLGAGGMGTVYEAEEVATSRHVALKLISAEYATAPDAVERFRREGRLASGISHPRCVFVLAADEEAGRPYIVMELMPGTTLRELVEQRGPLPPEEALAKILDVIDGLSEAHRLGVVHRDVKPSNCFLESDGRVKIGDFGLSKSLLRDGHLTRTGAFVGTPLFASPEQVRGEVVDPQSDLYSVAATLYFLLTGQAPFQSADAAVTLVRIAADPPPPMRTVRPELPQALDEVVLRGLERERQRRWRSLDEFRAALLPFLPGKQTAPRLGVRFGAFLIDYAVLTATGFLVGLVVYLATGRELMTPQASNQLAPWKMALGVLVWVLYLGVPESVAGCSLGKWFLGLRVRTTAGSGQPGPGRIALRTLLFYLFVNLWSLGALPLVWRLHELSPEGQLIRSLLVTVLIVPLAVLGIGLVVCTMRQRNGYRGLHEVLSGTRVVPLPEKEKPRNVRADRLDRPLLRPADLPERVGTYAVRGALHWQPDTQVLLGDDTALERRVVIWLRPQTEPPLDSARHAVTRPTRLRWLAGGKQDDWQWDAFLASAGEALPDLVAGGASLPWSEVRPMLEQLAEELTAAAREVTLPASLCVDQVWVQPGGQVQLLDRPLTGQESSDAGLDAEVTPSHHALALLGQAAVLSLEGRPLKADVLRSPSHPIQAPVPEHAARLLARLFSLNAPFESVESFTAELAATRDRPTEVTRARRAGHLALATAFLAAGLCCCMMPAGYAPGVLTVLFSTSEVEVHSQALDYLEQGTRQELAVSTVNPDPLWRLHALTQLDADLKQRDQLRERVERSKRDRETRRQTLGWLMREYTFLVDKDIHRRQPIARMRWGPSGLPGNQTAGFRLQASIMTETRESPLREVSQGIALTYLISLAVWPAVWMVWAFLWRGGLSYRWLGLALARSDGRRAARWQCALRALLVWAPIAVLWAAALGLEIRYWSDWPVVEADSLVLWLSSALWWVGVALLPLYAVLAVLYPRRSFHDWLAGTYLVPR